MQHVHRAWPTWPDVAFVRCGRSGWPTGASPAASLLAPSSAYLKAPPSAFCAVRPFRPLRAFRLPSSPPRTLPSAHCFSSTATMSSERATGLKATKGIELLTLSTPNGYKVSVLLEELKDAYGIDYTWQAIDISKGIQKEPWFVAINPNGRIPAIVDHDRGGVAVFEGLAILNYLARRFDVDHKFSFDPATEPNELAQAESWLAWQHGGLGPMHGQASYFQYYAAEQDAFAINRYVGETERLYGVLNTHLADRDYVAGAGRGRYSIVDMAIVGWAQALALSGADTSLFPHVLAWLERVQARPATARGLAVPVPAPYLTPDAAMLEKAAKAKAVVKAAQEKYNYKYKSP